MNRPRDRDPAGRARNARARDDLGRPLADRDLTEPADETPLGPDAALVKAQQLLDDGRPFAAHEVLEAVWKVTDTDRDLWRGLAQLAVGITHAARGNPAGATALLERAADTLAPYDDTTPHRIDVAGLRQWAVAVAVDPQRAMTPPPLQR